MTESDSVRAAFDRARTRLGLVHFLRRTASGAELYAVGSCSDLDNAWTVVVDAAGYRCSCPAGAHARSACWHRAAVHVKRANARARQEALGRTAGLLVEPPVPTPVNRLAELRAIYA